MQPELLPGDYILDMLERAQAVFVSKPTIHGDVESDCPRRYGYRHWWTISVRFRNSDGTNEALGCVALAAILALAAYEADRGESGPIVKGEVPQRILDPILNEAAVLANVAHEQLVIVRAESVVWNDGALGCP